MMMTNTTTTTTTSIIIIINCQVTMHQSMLTCFKKKKKNSIRTKFRKQKKGRTRKKWAKNGRFDLFYIQTGIDKTHIRANSSHLIEHFDKESDSILSQPKFYGPHHHHHHQHKCMKSDFLSVCVCVLFERKKYSFYLSLFFMCACNIYPKFMW